MVDNKDIHEMEFNELFEYAKKIGKYNKLKHSAKQRLLEELLLKYQSLSEKPLSDYECGDFEKIPFSFDPSASSEEQKKYARILMEEIWPKHAMGSTYLQAELVGVTYIDYMKMPIYGEKDINNIIEKLWWASPPFEEQDFERDGEKFWKKISKIFPGAYTEEVIDWLIKIENETEGYPFPPSSYFINKFINCGGNSLVLIGLDSATPPP